METPVPPTTVVCATLGPVADGEDTVTRHRSANRGKDVCLAQRWVDGGAVSNGKDDQYAICTVFQKTQDERALRHEGVRALLVHLGDQ